MMKIVWVVEMLRDGEWLPTSHSELTRKDGRIELWELKKMWTADKFRLVPYRRPNHCSHRSKYCQC